MIRSDFSHPIKVTKDGVSREFDFPYIITDSTFGAISVTNSIPGTVVEIAVPGIVTFTDVTQTIGVVCSNL